MPPGDGSAPPRRAPRYLAVLSTIRAEIAAASPNTVLPTEQVLARRFGVSRLTLRRALGLLERSGLVSRRPGRGTVVSPPKVTRVLAPLYTLEEDLRGQGIRLETRVLRYAPAIEPPPDVRLTLRLRRRSRVAAVELLRLVEGQVIAHDVAYVPTAFAARLRPERVGEHPLLDVLRQPSRIRLDRLDWEIEILPSEPEVAAPLGITPGMLVVASRATAYALRRRPGVAQRPLLSHRPRQVPRGHPLLTRDPGGRRLRRAPAWPRQKGSARMTLSSRHLIVGLALLAAWMTLAGSAQAQSSFPGARPSRSSSVRRGRHRRARPRASWPRTWRRSSARRSRS